MSGVIYVLKTHLHFLDDEVEKSHKEIQKMFHLIKNDIWDSGLLFVGQPDGETILTLNRKFLKLSSKHDDLTDAASAVFNSATGKFYRQLLLDVFATLLYMELRGMIPNPLNKQFFGEIALKISDSGLMALHIPHCGETDAGKT